MPTDKEFLQKEIQKHINVIYSHIDFDSPNIKIHLNSDKESLDYPRAFFILYTLSRCVELEFLGPEDRSKLLELFTKLYPLAKQELDWNQFRYVDLYGMRLLKNLNEDYSALVENFKKEDFANIFSYPVTNYLFVSAFFECSELQKLFPFSRSMLNQSLSVFDYLLFSNSNDKYSSFHFAEISGWPIDKEDYFYTQALKLIDAKFDLEIVNGSISSSGLAKTLEHYSRIGDTERVEMGINFLTSRKLSTFGEYINPVFESHAEDLYIEHKGYQYLCLDTNAHLLNMHLNLWNKK